MKYILFLSLSFVLILYGRVLPANEETATIFGKILLDTDPPALPQIVVEKNVEFCGETLTDPILVVQNRGIQGAVVSLDWERDVDTQADVFLPINLQSRGCQFQPRIQATQLGNYLMLNSGDEITHNPHGWWNNKKTIFNITLLKPTQKFKRKLRSEGTYRVECDTHTWMKAYILVFKHPFYTVTDEKGSFELQNVPAGKHTLRVWHEILGEQTTTVVVEPGKTAEKDFVLSLVDKRRKALIPKTVSPWPPNSNTP